MIVWHCIEKHQLRSSPLNLVTFSVLLCPESDRKVTDFQRAITYWPTIQAYMEQLILPQKKKTIEQRHLFDVSDFILQFREMCLLHLKPSNSRHDCWFDEQLIFIGNNNFSWISSTKRSQSSTLELQWHSLQWSLLRHRFHNSFFSDRQNPAHHCHFALNCFRGCELLTATIDSDISWQVTDRCWN
jgi:hypothetical protein